jgi:hypothetical protein
MAADVTSPFGCYAADVRAEASAFDLSRSRAQHAPHHSLIVSCYIVLYQLAVVLSKLTSLSKAWLLYLAVPMHGLPVTQSLNVGDGSIWLLPSVLQVMQLHPTAPGEYVLKEAPQPSSSNS